MNTDTISPQLLAQLQSMRTQTTQAYQKSAEQRDVPRPSRDVRAQDAAVKIEISAEAQRMARELEEAHATRPAHEVTPSQSVSNAQATSSVEFVSLVAEADAADALAKAGSGSELVASLRREAPFAHVRAGQESEAPLQRPGSILDISV